MHVPVVKSAGWVRVHLRGQGQQRGRCTALVAGQAALGPSDLQRTTVLTAAGMDAAGAGARCWPAVHQQGSHAAHI